MERISRPARGVRLANDAAKVMAQVGSLVSGAGVLAVLWFGPLSGMTSSSFTAHMTVHISVVAIAAPLIAIGLAGTRYDPVAAAPAIFAPLPASIIEFLVVSAWHTPILHHAARTNGPVFAAEQLTFLASGLLLWLAAVGGAAGTRRWRAVAGAGALLFTSMHMTLLGALFALTPRPLYAHGGTGAFGLSALNDQHLGGTIMLIVGGASYLTGGLWLAARALRWNAGTE
jgi:putative membrane protein